MPNNNKELKTPKTRLLRSFRSDSILRYYRYILIQLALFLIIGLCINMSSICSHNKCTDPVHLYESGPEYSTSKSEEITEEVKVNPKLEVALKAQKAKEKGQKGEKEEGSTATEGDWVTETGGSTEYYDYSTEQNVVVSKGGPRVLCWIMTYPKNHNTSAKAVINTWGSHCDKLLVFSSQNDTNLGIIGIPGSVEGRNGLWGKTKGAFEYAYKHHFKDFDWFLKADDDSFVVPENLKHFVSGKNPKDPVYFGCNYKVIVKQSYMAGGGYVLSKEALRRFAKIGLKNGTLCRQDGQGAEDAEMGLCLEKLGVVAGDSRDERGRYRFLPLPTESHLTPASDWSPDYWFNKNIKYPHKLGNQDECCSTTMIAFHYVDVRKMYLLNFLLYKMRPYGFTYTF